MSVLDCRPDVCAYPDVCEVKPRSGQYTPHIGTRAEDSDPRPKMRSHPCSGQNLHYSPGPSAMAYVSLVVSLAEVMLTRLRCTRTILIRCGLQGYLPLIILSARVLLCILADLISSIPDQVHVRDPHQYCREQYHYARQACSERPHSKQARRHLPRQMVCRFMD